MEAALAAPASMGADVSMAADAATANTMVLMFVPLLPLPTQRETLQLVPGAKWCITGPPTIQRCHDPGCDAPHSEATPAVQSCRCGRRPASAPRNRRSAAAGMKPQVRRYSLLSRKAPTPGERFEWNEQ